MSYLSSPPFPRHIPRMPTWQATNPTQGELSTSRHHLPSAIHAPRPPPLLEPLCLPLWARTSWITGVAGQALLAHLHLWITARLWAAPPAGRKGVQGSQAVWVTAAQPTAQRRSSTVWPASSLRGRPGGAPTLHLPHQEAFFPARCKSTTLITTEPDPRRLSRASPAQPGPAPLSPSSAKAAMSAASRPCLTGTTTRCLSAQNAACRLATAATLRIGSVKAEGSSSGQVPGRTAPPRTLCCYYSSQDQDLMESPTGPTETGKGVQVGANQLLIIPEHALKTCWPSTIATAAR